MNDSISIETYDMDHDGKVLVFYEDIPNLIKALQAAYDHKEGTK